MKTAHRVESSLNLQQEVVGGDLQKNILNLACALLQEKHAEQTRECEDVYVPVWAWVDAKETETEHRLNWEKKKGSAERRKGKGLLIQIPSD